MKLSRSTPWLGYLIAALALGVVCAAYLRPDMVLAAGEAMWLCLQ